jgi:hypothetical protein
MRQEEEHPAREDQVVMFPRQVGVGEQRVPDAPFAEPIAARQCVQPRTKRGGRLDRIHRAADAPPKFEVHRALAGADLQHVPSALDAEPIEELPRNRIPQARLRPEASGFAVSVPQQVPVRAVWFHQRFPALTGVPLYSHEHAAPGRSGQSRMESVPQSLDAS